jgi:glycosyltransferase involved in cell wall biosynthesis
MSHNELIPKLRKCDAFILPYPEGNYFRNRFPLKALEYAALFRPILVTDTIAHRNIFDSSEVWFYSPENCLHLSNSINDLISDKGKVLKKLQNAYAKAQAHTYSRRVQDILDLLDL